MSYKTIHPIQLIWHNALEVVKQLFSNPIFANHITFQPHIVNIKNQHKYEDYMIQDCLPLGAMQVPIILGTTRGLEMHPIFITIAWHCIAYMPIAKFHVHPNYQTILWAWLWHKCIDLTGCFMTNPSKLIHYVFMPLVAHVSMVSKNIFKMIDKAAKAVNLSEILHTCLKFFADHPLKWTKEVVGKPKLDACFITYHKQVETHYFTKGITHHWDIQCTIIASIVGAAPPRFICTLYALVEFIYLTQNLTLLDFHTFKDTIIEAQARRGKKGSKEYFLVDMTEHLLITHCKDLFVQTNQQANDFVEQSV
ncbi:hypothetical protein BDR06DRAFT_981314 [Suillus hirtellus]|nr:hypothetical protein BDR06DRAFT_981314 [Suillus hirtellus]